MGYTTTFEGQFILDRPLTPEHKAYLERFARTRHMLWDESQLSSIPDPVRGATGLPLGPAGIYFTGITDYSISFTHYSRNGRPDYHPALIDYNETPIGIPGLWCKWGPNEQGTAIEWNGAEKFYGYVEWLQFLVENFLVLWDYTLNGTVKWQGEDRTDKGTIEVKLNDIIITEEEVTEEDEESESDEINQSQTPQQATIDPDSLREHVYSAESQIQRAIDALAPIHMDAILEIREMIPEEDA